MARRPSAVSQTTVDVPEQEVTCPLARDDGKPCKKRCMGEKRFRSMQEHIRRAHPEYHIPKLPATEESFMMMINTPPGANPRTDDQVKSGRKSISGADSIPSQEGPARVDSSPEKPGPNSFLDDMGPPGQNGDGSAPFSDDMFQEPPGHHPPVSAPGLPILKAINPTSLNPVPIPDFSSNFLSDPATAMVESHGTRPLSSSGPLQQVSDAAASIWGEPEPSFGVDMSAAFAAETDTAGLITMDANYPFLDGDFSLFPATNDVLEHSQQQPVFLNEESASGIWNSNQIPGLPGPEPENHLGIEMPSMDDLHHQFTVDEHAVEAGDADPISAAASFAQRRASVPNFPGANVTSKPRVKHSRKMSVPETLSHKSGAISSIPSPIRKKTLKRKHTDAGSATLPDVKEEPQLVEKISRPTEPDHAGAALPLQVVKQEVDGLTPNQVPTSFSSGKDNSNFQRLLGLGSANSESKPISSASQVAQDRAFAPGETHQLQENAWSEAQLPVMAQLAEHPIAAASSTLSAAVHTGSLIPDAKSSQATNGVWMDSQDSNSVISNAVSDEVLKLPAGVAHNILQEIQSQREAPPKSLAMPKGMRLPLKVEPWLSQADASPQTSLRQVGVAQIQLNLEFIQDQHQRRVSGVPASMIHGGVQAGQLESGNPDGDGGFVDGHGQGGRAAKRLCKKLSADSMLMIPTITLPNMANEHKSAELSPPTLSVLSHDSSAGYPWNITVTLPSQSKSTLQPRTYSVPVFEVPSELSREMGLNNCTPPQTSTTDSGLGFDSPPGNNPLTPVSAATTPNCGPNQQGLGSPVPDLRLRQSYEELKTINSQTETMNSQLREVSKEARTDLNRVESILAALQFADGISNQVQLRGMVTEASEILATVKGRLG